MPSWKKVIVSGSDASLSSLNVATSLTASIISASSGITGSLFGTSSWAQNSLTSSFITPTGTNAFVQGGNSFGATALLGTNDTQDLQLETSGSVRMTISSSGNVGIGTTTPSVRLHISGTSATNELVYLTGDASQGSAIRFNRGSSYSWRMGVVPNSNFTIEDVSYSTVRFQINNTSGLIGINTTSPNARLHISGANNEALLIASSSTAPSALFVSGSGNVGIGTTTPASRLQVSLPSNTSNQSIFRSDAGDNLLAINTFPTTNRMQLLLGDYNGTATPNLAAISDSNTGIQWAGSDIIRFVNGGSENVTINASGNVGIGTATPSSRLHARGSGATSATTALRVENSNATASLVVRDDGNVGIGITSPTDLLDVFSSSDNQRLIRISHPTAPTQAAGFFGFNSDGVTNNVVVTLGVQYSSVYYNVINIKRDTQNVGIGTTSPTSRLQVRGSGATSATTALRVENSNQNASLVVLDDGTVGIGTTAPSASLHVQGNLQISTGSLYTYGQNTDIDSGSIRTVMSVATGSYRAAFFDYVLNKSTNARAGIVFSVWNGTSVEWNDVSTNDIGNTTEVNLSVGLSGANVILYASSSTNDWSMKALARML